MESKPTYQDLENQIADLKKQHEIFLLLSSSHKEGSVNYYNTILNNIGDPVFVKDHKSKLLIVNDAFCEIFNLSRDNIIGKTLAEDVPDAEREIFLKIDRQVLEDGVENINEESLTVRGGESLTILTRKTRYIDSDGNKFLIGIIRDISERKKAEETLRLSEAKFRGLFIQSHVGTAIVGLDHSFIRCNKAFCRFLGYSEEELIGKKIAEFTYPEDKEIGMKEMKKMVEGEIKSALLQKRYLRKDGVVVWGELTISIVRGEANKPLYFLPIIQDITERHLAEQMLKESEASLKELNATKDKLFSIIAHDLRSPFTGILGFSELLKENLKESTISQSEKYATLINSSAKNTLVLLDNLLNWAKSQTGQINFNPQKIVLSSSIQEIIEMTNSQAKVKNISIHKVESDEIEVSADENMLKIILRNLISNAIKFTKSGGNINIVLISNENHVEISISDNGIGINEEKLKTLFNIISNTTSLGTANEKGSGLGLVLCKEFVEKQGGIIWVESLEGKGSDFKFTLPLYKS